MLTLLFFLCSLASEAQGYLRAKGPIIVDGQGKKIILRGMGLGGWMLQEGYMFRLANFGQQHKIRAAIQDLAGQQRTDAFYAQWLDNHTRKQDIDSMAAWGFNSVRLPMHYRLFTKAVEEEPIAGENTWLEKGFAMTDSLLSWCKANKIYLILDLHAAPGGQGNDLNISDRYPDRPSLWESAANQQKMIALWRKLAERYANEPWIGGYDIINEPNWGFENPTDKIGNREKTNAPLKTLMMEVTKAIRQVDKHHLIIIEGNAFGNNYNGILPGWDPNMALSFHKYGTFNDEASIRRYLDLREQYQLPLWMGESGENSNGWYTEAIRLVETHDIGWSWWPLKKMGSNNPLEIRVTPSYQRLLDYWGGKGPKPSPEEAGKALDEWIQSIRIEHNIFHKDVTDAMFRQVDAPTAIPFKKVFIRDSAVVAAVDYDLGGQRVAYYDKDTARYQYASPPVNSAGNRGREYRNDGVDIQSGDRAGGSGDQTGGQGYYVFNIEDKEWLQYTVDVAKEGDYSLQLRIAAASDTGRISVMADDRAPVGVAVPNTGGLGNWQLVEAGTIHLHKGANVLRILADKGGWNFKEILLAR